jgi:hypothetical protein
MALDRQPQNRVDIPQICPVLTDPLLQIGDAAG